MWDQNWSDNIMIWGEFNVNLCSSLSPAACERLKNTAVLPYFWEHDFSLFLLPVQSLLDGTVKHLDLKTLTGIQYVPACHQMKFILKNACYDGFQPYPPTPGPARQTAKRKSFSQTGCSSSQRATDLLDGGQNSEWDLGNSKPAIDSVRGRTSSEKC